MDTTKIQQIIQKYNNKLSQNIQQKTPTYNKNTREYLRTPQIIPQMPNTTEITQAIQQPIEQTIPQNTTIQYNKIQQNTTKYNKKYNKCQTCTTQIEQ